MRALVTAIVLGVTGAALLPSHDALAWRDGYGRWHPDYYAPRVFYAPRPFYAPPPVYYAPRPAYYPGYAHWIRPHYDRFGRFIPGHWI